MNIIESLCNNSLIDFTVSKLSNAILGNSVRVNMCVKGALRMCFCRFNLLNDLLTELWLRVKSILFIMHNINNTVTTFLNTGTLSRAATYQKDYASAYCLDVYS